MHQLIIHKVLVEPHVVPKVDSNCDSCLTDSVIPVNHVMIKFTAAAKDAALTTWLGCTAPRLLSPYIVMDGRTSA